MEFEDWYYYNFLVKFNKTVNIVIELLNNTTI